MWINQKTGEVKKSTRDLVYALHKQEKKKEVEHYCAECKEKTKHLYIKKYGQYQCLECANSYFK
jgi:hypothetical protein